MIRGIVFDLDGTLYCGDTAVDGAVDTVSALRALGLRVFYLTNNSAKMGQRIVEKLRRIGFPAAIYETYCASYAVSKYLAQENLTPVYAVGTDGLKCEIRAQGIRIEDSPKVSAVVVGLDPSLDYHKISLALLAITKGAKLVVANLDPWYPAGDGKILPGCGAMVGAIVGATGHAPDFLVGKPNTYMLELLCREHGLLPKEICVVGDVPESDIAMAKRFGSPCVLFDPENKFPEFPGQKVRKLPELVPLIERRQT